MENITSEMLQKEQQSIPQDEQTQEDNQIQQEEQATTEKTSGFRTAFEKFSGAVLGICSIIGTIGLVVWIAWGIIGFCEGWYDHWFGDLYGMEIGKNGLVYVPSRDAVMKTSPNKEVLADITRLTKIDDSMGIVCYKGKEGLLDLNTAKFVLLAQYDKLWNPTKNTYMAEKNDTIYTIMVPGGEIVKREPTADFYTDIRPIYEIDDVYYSENEGDVLLYEYTDYLGNCGMMSKDLQKLTPAIYSHIEAVRGKKDVFLCRFDECDEKHRSDEDDVCYYGVGELRNSKGEKIE